MWEEEERSSADTRDGEDRGRRRAEQLRGKEEMDQNGLAAGGGRGMPFEQKNTLIL